MTNKGFGLCCAFSSHQYPQRMIWFLSITSGVVVKTSKNQTVFGW